jgi:hypothetical protein
MEITILFWETTVTEVQYFLIIIWSEGVVQEGNIASFTFAECAAEEQDQTFFTGKFVAYGSKKALAAVGPISWIDIHVFAV